MKDVSAVTPMLAQTKAKVTFDGASAVVTLASFATYEDPETGQPRTISWSEQIPAPEELNVVLVALVDRLKRRVEARVIREAYRAVEEMGREGHAGSEE